MTPTATLSPPLRGSVADTETGVPRSQNTNPDMTTKSDDQDHSLRSQPPRENDPTRNATIRRTSIDWETGSVIFRVIDEHSGQTLSQSPEEALLRLRAYARQTGSTPATTEITSPLSPRTEKTV